MVNVDLHGNYQSSELTTLRGSLIIDKGNRRFKFVLIISRNYNLKILAHHRRLQLFLFFVTIFWHFVDDVTIGDTV
jgi:hypothetical protein